MGENDADEEIAALRSKYEKILKTERTQTLELRGNNGMLKREFAGLQQRIKNGNDKMQSSLVEQNKLVEEIRRFEKDIDGYEREIGERDSTIAEKNKMIGEVQKKNQELEKFKFVLDYKIHELDRQIKPREVQIEEMNDELSSYTINNRILSLNVKDLKLKLKGLQNEKDENNSVNESMINLIKVIGHQLSSLSENANDEQKLKHGIIELNRQFEDIDLSAPVHSGLPGDENANKNDVNVKKDGKLGLHEEFQRHRNYLERTVQGLQKKLVKDQAGFKKDSTRIMQENVALIKEINELRKEISIAKKMKNQNSKSSRAQTTGSQKRQIKENEEEILELLELKKELEAIDSQQ